MTRIVKIKGSLHSKKYQKVLKKYLIPDLAKLSGDNYIFMQDNAPAHTSEATLDFMQKNKVKIMSPPIKPQT